MDLVCRCSSPILRPSHGWVEQVQTANGEDSKVPSDRVHLPNSRRQCWREELLFRSKGCLGCIGHGWSAEDGRLDSSFFVCEKTVIIENGHWMSGCNGLTDHLDVRLIAPSDIPMAPYPRRSGQLVTLGKFQGQKGSHQKRECLRGRAHIT